MATKKSSTTKAKIKTSAKKTTAAKTTSKPAPAKVVSSPPKAVNIQKLRSLHIMSVGVFLLLAILAGMLMNHQSHPLTIGYLTKDILSAHEATLAPAVRSVYDVEIRWLVVGIMLLSTVLPLLYLGRWEKKYTDALNTKRTVPWRWIDFAVTAALMVETTALLSGVQDVVALKLIGGLIGVSLWLAWIAEKQNDGAGQPVWSSYVAGVISGALPWVLIGVSAVSTVIFGAVWSPWYVYALYAALIAGAVSLACIQFKNYQQKLTAWHENYLVVERNYLAVNLLTKAAFGIILIVGLLK